MEQTSSFVFDPHVQWATAWKRLIRTFSWTLVVVEGILLEVLVTSTAFATISEVNSDDDDVASTTWLDIVSFSWDGADGNISDDSLRRFRDGV